MEQIKYLDKFVRYYGIKGVNDYTIHALLPFAIPQQGNDLVARLAESNERRYEGLSEEANDESHVPEIPPPPKNLLFADVTDK